MRDAFVGAISDEAERRPKMIVLTADLGYSVFEAFEAKFPRQFLKLGIVEAAMVGMAAGLAMSGHEPVVYTIATFMSMRCFEQIRNDLCYQGVAVKVVGVGAGLSYGSLAGTHHAQEDIALMRGLPNMTVLCPADPVETRWATSEMMRVPGPVYLRLGKRGEKKLHEPGASFRLGRGVVLRDGNDVTLIGCGPILENVLASADELARHGVSARVVSMHTVKPIDHDLVLSSAKSTGAVVTVEEHNRTGGLGTAVAEVLAEGGSLGTRFVRIGIPDSFSHVIGSHDWCRQHAGSSPAGIAEEVLRRLEPGRGGK